MKHALIILFVILFDINIYSQSISSDSSYKVENFIWKHINFQFVRPTLWECDIDTSFNFIESRYNNDTLIWHSKEGYRNLSVFIHKDTSDKMIGYTMAVFISVETNINRKQSFQKLVINEIKNHDMYINDTCIIDKFIVKKGKYDVISTICRTGAGYYSYETFINPKLKNGYIIEVGFDNKGHKLNNIQRKIYEDIISSIIVKK